MGTLGQSGLPPVENGQGGALSGRWEPRGRPLKFRRAGRMPTWLAVLACLGALFGPFAPLHRSLDAIALASLFFATFANLCAGVLAGRDEHRRLPLRWMYGWDWIALGVSAVGGPAVLLSAVSRSGAFDRGLAMMTLAAILGLLAAIRHRLVASEPRLANVEDVFR